jgi:hypothetical protein
MTRKSLRNLASASLSAAAVGINVLANNGTLPPNGHVLALLVAIAALAVALTPSRDERLR